MTSIAEANKAVHKVEDQWHYKTMTQFGFTSLDKEQTSLVRTYRYVNDKTGYEISVTTGYSADYWRDNTGSIPVGKTYWADLEPHLVKLKEAKYI